MAWEWVGPVATATVGIAGIFGTWLNGKQGRDDARTLAGESLKHERLLAKEEREHKRLENAYLELLGMAERAGLWASNVHPFMDTDPPQPVPPLPSLESQAHIRALISAFGSEQVKSAMANWVFVMKSMVTVAGEINLEDAEGIRESGENPRLTLDKLRNAELEARKHLAETISAELRSPIAD
ncbi:hypothetical protein FIV07_16135 [Mycobacterium sp. THAF192]|nr:hypothetical protein FIV07_16135 [Mycobacterium sp. THAF192]